MSARSRLAARGLVRPRHGRWIAGVAAAIAERFGVRPSVVRIAWILSLLIPGPQVVLYVALWILIPGEGEEAEGPIDA